MPFRKRHPVLFRFLCVIGGFVLLMGVTFACMYSGLGRPLAVIWGAVGLALYYLPTLMMLRWMLRSLRIYRRGTVVSAMCTANFTAGHMEHCLVTWEDADGSHTEDIGYATLNPRRTPYPVTLCCYAGQYSLGMESIISGGISLLLFLLVQSAVLIPLICQVR